MAPDVPEVLFVCVHNAGRSQMAAALLDRHAAGRVRVRSAGSAPAGEIDARVRALLAELLPPTPDDPPVRPRSSARVIHRLSSINDE